VLVFAGWIAAIAEAEATVMATAATIDFRLNFIKTPIRVAGDAGGNCLDCMLLNPPDHPSYRRQLRSVRERHREERAGLVPTTLIR